MKTSKSPNKANKKRTQSAAAGRLQTASALAVADYIINLQKVEYGLDISHLKLQKLLYYCQAFHLAGKGEPLFKEDLLAWSYGPVVREVYDKYKVYGNGVIPFSEGGDGEELDSHGISVKGMSTIASVLEAYGKLSAISLMERTHKEPPWMNAYSKKPGSVISHSDMKKYYKKFINKVD